MIFVLVINFKVPTLIGILKFMTRKNDNACSSEQEHFPISLQFAFRPPVARADVRSGAVVLLLLTLC